MSVIILATANPGKVKEFNTLFENTGLTIIPQSEKGITSVEETGLTFVENALLKARHASYKTGLAAIADDSGLAVDALNGAPGIFSARYAGENACTQQHIEKLLQSMKNVKPHQRQAKFHCVLVYLRHAEDPTPIICQASWAGEIALVPSEQKGFGYDPVFYLPELGKTAAELTKIEKNAISHRGKAMKCLLDALKNVISSPA